MRDAHVYEIGPVLTELDAQRAVEFCLSDDSFEDQRHTPGELQQLQSIPFEALQSPGQFCWLAKKTSGDVIGIVCFAENGHSTGGYRLDYLAISRCWRRQGVAAELLRRVKQFVHNQAGRFIETYTCDLPVYEPARRMFELSGFRQVGHIPDYYFEGEGKLFYYCKLSSQEETVHG
ncbi:GNAT family N-acetyltransferase [Paenibacillus sp. y28]|uniref:GNAT family N-acetyltransferase n=1 Tax=Paenibacillus sp. y28 TaxID=3129110 RepID=UPI003018170D